MRKTVMKIFQFTTMERVKKRLNLESLKFIILEVEKNKRLKVTVFFLSTHFLIHYKVFFSNLY